MAKYSLKATMTYFYGRLKTVFADKTEFENLQTQVQGIVNQGGEVNTINTVKVNGTALTPDSNKAVNVVVPTDTSELNNTAGFITATALAGLAEQASVYTKAETDTAISTALAGISGVSFQVVSDLPQQGESGIFYLKAITGGKNKNLYEEWVWVNKGTSQSPDWDFEQIGTTSVDLTGYLKEEDIEPLTTQDIDDIFNASNNGGGE